MDARITEPVGRSQANAEGDAHVRRILAIHFDEKGGAPFWIERQRQLGFDVMQRVRSVDDLVSLGPMDEEALRTQPLSAFIPLSRRPELTGAIIAETGGTTGTPKRTIYTSGEFRRAFVDPFVCIAEKAGFPRGVLWLWLGPSGPHIIGHAAAACATALDSPQPLSVDFDPRWYRKLPVDSLARSRYMEHLLEQALCIVEAELIEVLFTTPVLLGRLAERMTTQQRERIRGVHYGGMRVEPELLRAAQTDWFPNAVHLAGYGNTLFGVCMEFGGGPDRPLCYFPFGPRHIVRVVDSRVWMSRLDPTMLIANFPERDMAAPVTPPLEMAQLGFGDGVEDPRPIPDSERVAQGGIY